MAFQIALMPECFNVGFIDAENSSKFADLKWNIASGNVTNGDLDKADLVPGRN